MKLFVLFISVLFTATPADLSTVRKKYIEAAQSEEAAKELHAMVEGTDDGSSNTTMVAYKAASITLQAKYAKGLLTKKNLFTKGAKLLESVVAKDADNYEVRLIRLNIQENAPGITGYNDAIEGDKAFLVKHYNTQPDDLKQFTKNFVKMSSSFSADEKAAFK